MMLNNYDVIIIGAGSVGVPTAISLGEKGIKTLVIDFNSSPGQGDNKKAIGGIRATHSDPAKILIGKRSLEIFSTWKEIYGDNIEWMEGGYLFPIYREKEKKLLKSLFSIQRRFNLNIEYISSNQTKKLIPGINSHNLLGATFSKHDGSASPLLSINSFVKRAIMNGVKFKFKEKVEKIITYKNKISGLVTNKDKYSAPIIIDAAGGYSNELCRKMKIKIEVTPEAHEAGITEPIERIFKCMVVDLRRGPGSKNFYLYQNIHGQIVFCISPDPSILKQNTGETSTFLPQVSKRILNLLPFLCNVRVRRIWRGTYPMTPDASPIVGKNKNIKGLYHATGMCGQGFMLGPGLGEYISRDICVDNLYTDKIIKKTFSPQRKFHDIIEALK